MKSQPTLIFCCPAEGTQDVTYEAVYRLGAFTLRIDIRRDSYDFQSHAICKVFSTADTEWKFLTDLHYSHIRSERKRNIAAGWFIAGYEDDVNELLERASLILGAA